MSDVSSLCGISGLSFDSFFLSPLSFFCLVQIHKRLKRRLLLRTKHNMLLLRTKHNMLSLRTKHNMLLLRTKHNVLLLRTKHKCCCLGQSTTYCCLGQSTTCCCLGQNTTCCCLGQNTTCCCLGQNTNCFLTFSVFGSCFRTLAVILVSDFSLLFFCQVLLLLLSVIFC